MSCQPGQLSQPHFSWVGLTQAFKQISVLIFSPDTDNYWQNVHGPGIKPVKFPMQAETHYQLR